MPSTTSSAKALVKKTKKHKKSWWEVHVSGPFAKINFSAIWGQRKGSTTARSIYLNSPLPPTMFNTKGKILKENKYPTNQTISSKYTVLTFLPRNLLEQFRRIANIFFLFIDILQLFPKFSTISPGLVFLPLIAVLLITALKDGWEDIKRHQADRHVNNSIVHTLAGASYENPNRMKGKARTFVPAIAMPSRKSKKARKGEKGTTEVLQRSRGNTETQPPSARPNGQELNRTRSQVAHWVDDPEAGDSPEELGWHRSRWEDVKVGDVVKIYENEQFPAGEPGPYCVQASLMLPKISSSARRQRRKMSPTSRRRIWTERPT